MSRSVTAVSLSGQVISSALCMLALWCWTIGVASAEEPDLSDLAGDVLIPGEAPPASAEALEMAELMVHNTVRRVLFDLGLPNDVTTEAISVYRGERTGAAYELTKAEQTTIGTMRAILKQRKLMRSLDERRSPDAMGRAAWKLFTMLDVGLGQVADGVDTLLTQGLSPELADILRQYGALKRLKDRIRFTSKVAAKADDPEAQLTKLARQVTPRCTGHGSSSPGRRSSSSRRTWSMASTCPRPASPSWWGAQRSLRA